MSENRAGINAEGACHSVPRYLMSNSPRPPRDLPVLIAGPTASGKSSLALEIARAWKQQGLLRGPLLLLDSGVATGPPASAELTEGTLKAQ